MRKTKAGMTVKVTAIFALLYSFIFFPDIGAPPPAFALDSVFTDNVGIGTTAPAKTLDVAGDIRSTSLEVSGAGDANIGHDLYLSNSVSSQIYSNKALTIISGAVGQNLDLTLQGRGTGKVYVDDNLQATGTIRFSGLTSDGFVKTSGGDGTISVSSLGTGDLPSTVMLEGENISLLNNNSGFITDDTSVPKNHLTSSGTLGFTWGTGETAAKDTSDDAWTGTGNVYTTSGNVGIGTTTPLQSIGGGGSYSDWLGTHVKKDNYGIMVVEAGTRARLQLTDSNAAVDKKNFAIDVIDGLLEFNSVNDALTGSSQLIVVNPSGNVGIGYGNAGVAKLAINGNVGIGTTNPIASLDMGSGSIRLGGTTLSSWPTGADNLGNHIATQNLRMSGYWLSNDGGNEGVWVKSDGNVGVGTSSPIANLDIVNTGYTGLLVHGVENAAFRVKNDAGGGDFLDIQPATAGIDIQVNDSNVMRLSDANGNIGIGTTNPAQKLDVSGNIKSTGYGIFPTGIVPAATGAPDGKVFSPSGDYLASTTWGINYNEGSPDYIEFNNASAVTSRIALDDGSAHFALNGGNVGVGTNSPTAGYKLDVNGNLRVGGATLLIAETCCGTGLQMNNRAITGPDSIAFADTNEGITWTGGNTYIREMDAGYLSLYDGNAIVLEGSNVGIATTAPKHRLQIASSSNVTGLAFFTPTYDLSQQWGTRMYKSDTGGGIPLIVESQNTSTWYESARFDDGQTVGTHPSFQTRGHTYLAAITGNVGIGTTNPLSKLSIVGLSSGSQTTAVMTDGSGNLSTRALNSVAFNGETGLGTVTSVGLSAPAEFTVSGSPVTTSGTLTFSKANQNANLVYAGPSSGAAAAPAFRALVDNDIPDTITASNYLTTGGTAANANACSGDASCNVNSVLYPDSPSNYVLSQGNWGIYWNTADSGTYQNSYEFRGGGTTRHDLELGTGNAYFSIGAGNVGIGTTAPATQLSMPQTTSRLSWGTPLNNIYQLGVSGGGALLLGVNGDSEYIGFETHLSGNSHQERMRITEIGNVGIGTTAPLASLEVGGTGIRLGGVTRTTWPTDTDTNASTICNGSTTYLDGDGNCDTGYLDADGSDDDAPDSDGEVPDNISINNGNLYSISGSGNVGIGITNPGYKLDVSGDTRTSGMYYSTGSATVKFGNVNTSGWGVDALNTGNWDLLIYN
ncbi:MAG: hypothetical protein PHQ43_01605, partial [Dehalococcoidales bacterium]|nr:hypothetical protein [Dehalococcoidales bacterium]